MFEILSEKFTRVFQGLSSRGRLGEKDIDEALHQIRLALLEADVNFKVVKDFAARVRERAIDMVRKRVNEWFANPGYGKIWIQHYPASSCSVTTIENHINSFALFDKSRRC